MSGVDLTPAWKRYCEPEAGHIYTMGVDTSEGLGHGDNSCVQVLDHETGEQAAVFCDMAPPDILAVLAYRMGRYYQGALMVVEANAQGIATLTVLRQLGYRSLFRRRTINRTFNRQTDEYGFKTSRTSKPLVISQLDEALRNGELVLHELETVVELKGYTRDEKGRMSGSPFDDRVMALALANYGRQFTHQRVVEETPEEDDYNTFAWWRRTVEAPEGDRLVIGAHNRRRGQVISLYE